MDGSHGTGSSSALTVALDKIFSENVYNAEVLKLRKHHSEVALNEEVGTKLAMLGIDVDSETRSLPRFHTYPTSTAASTVTTEPRSVGSYDTLGSRSTAFTSDPSRSSRERQSSRSSLRGWKNRLTYEKFTAKITNSSSSLPTAISSVFLVQRPTTSLSRRSMTGLGERPEKKLNRVASHMSLKMSSPRTQTSRDSSPRPSTEIKSARTSSSYNRGISRIFRRGFSSSSKSKSLELKREDIDPISLVSSRSASTRPDSAHVDPEVEQKLQESFSVLRKEITEELRRFDAFERKQANALALVHACLRETRAAQHAQAIEDLKRKVSAYTSFHPHLFY